MLTVMILILIARASKLAVFNPTDYFQSPAEVTLLTQLLQRSFQVQIFTEATLADLLIFAPDIALDYSSVELQVARHAALMYPRKLWYRSDFQLRPSNAFSLVSGFRKEWGQQVKAFASYFGWSEAFVILQSDLDDTRAELLDVDFEIATVAASLSRSVYYSLIARVVRQSGIKNIFIVAQQQLTEALLAVFAEIELDTGYSLISIGPDCVFDASLYPVGLICTTLAGIDNATSASEREALYIQNALAARVFNTWKVFNIVKGVKRLVGGVLQGKLIPTSFVVFPGGLLTPPDNNPLQLLVNLNNWTPDLNTNIQRATDLAFSDFTLSNPKFKVASSQLPACSAMDPTTGYLDCYIATKRSKVSMLLSSDRTIAVVLQNEYMRRASLQMAFINDFVGYQVLESVENYPNFLRIVQKTFSVTGYFTVMMRFLHFDKESMFVDASFGVDAIVEIRARLEQYNIEVVTKPELSPMNFTDPTYADKFAKSVESSLIRPLEILGLRSTVLRAVCELYDVGLRAKDLILILPFLSYGLVYALASEEEAVKVLEFVPSVINMQFASFVSEYGESLIPRFAKAYGSTYSADCYTYDLTKLSIIALDFALKRGLDFYDWKDIIFSLRSVKVQGCTGGIYFSEENNDRKSIDVDLSQPRMVDGQMDEFKVMKLSLTGQMYTLYSDFLWYDGSSVTPNIDRLTYQDCPFPEEYRTDAVDSQHLTAWISFALAGLACIVVAVCLVVDRWKLRVTIAEVPILPSTQDCIALLSLYSEPLILDVLNPYSGICTRIFSLVKGTPIEPIDLIKGGNYFALLMTTYVLAGTAITATALSAMKKFRPLLVDIQLLAFAVLRPLFVVLAFSMMTVFDCSEAEVDEGTAGLTDAFMDVDCYEGCWTGKHKAYAIGAAITLSVLLVVSIPLSYHISNSLDGMQLETSRLYLYLRQAVIMTVLGFYKSRRALSSLTHAALYVTILLVYTGICFMYRVLSIPRLDLLHTSLWGSLVVYNFSQLFYFEAYPNLILWTLLGGGCTMLIAGLTAYRFYKLPNLIQKTPAVNTIELFNFAFRPSAVLSRQKYTDRPSMLVLNVTSN